MNRALVVETWIGPNVKGVPSVTQTTTATTTTTEIRVSSISSCQRAANLDQALAQSIENPL